MKFVLFVEGHTEHKAIPSFLKRWLDPKLSPPVGIKAVRSEGCSEFLDDVGKKAHMHLDGQGSGKVIAVIGLLDLYGLRGYPASANTADERLKWASKHIEGLVKHKRFR